MRSSADDWPDDPDAALDRVQTELQHAREHAKAELNDPINDITTAIDRLQAAEDDPRPDRLEELQRQLVDLREETEVEPSTSPPSEAPADSNGDTTDGFESQTAAGGDAGPSTDEFTHTPAPDDVEPTSLDSDSDDTQDQDGSTGDPSENRAPAGEGTSGEADARLRAATEGLGAVQRLVEDRG